MDIVRDAMVLAVHDGDTITADVDYPLDHVPGERLVKQQHLRVYGIQAAELDSKDPAARLKAEQAKKFLSDLLLNKKVRVQIVHPDKFGGRFDAHVLVDGANVSDLMVRAGMAQAWDGKGAKPSGV